MGPQTSRAPRGYKGCARFHEGLHVPPRHRLEENVFGSRDHQEAGSVVDFFAFQNFGGHG